VIKAAGVQDTQTKTTATKVPATAAWPASPAQTPIDVASTVNHEFTPYHDRTSEHGKPFSGPTTPAAAVASTCYWDIGSADEFERKILDRRQAVDVADLTPKQSPGWPSSEIKQTILYPTMCKSNKSQTGKPSWRERY